MRTIQELASRERTPADRYGSANLNLMSLIPPASRNFLELGCSTGKLGKLLREKFSVERLVGVEADLESARLADPHYDDVLVTELDQLELPYAEAVFDTLIAGDILEHLADPEAVLRYCRQFMVAHGSAMVCLPNVRNLSLLEALARGTWRATDLGLLDRTHRHFFSRRTAMEMFERAGFVCQADGMVYVSATWLNDCLPPETRWSAEWVTRYDRAAEAARRGDVATVTEALKQWLASGLLESIPAAEHSEFLSVQLMFRLTPRLL